MTERAVSTVVGVAALLAVTVALAAGAGIALQAAAGTAASEGPPQARLELSADPDGTVVLAHVGGDRLDVGTLRVWVAVDGEALDDQPPVPFFSAHGFVSGPTGPFNAASDPAWTAGETAGVRVASTNSPTVDRGSTVTVRVYADDDLIFEGTTTAG
ncbi:type IV pilin [Halobacteriales archaeon QS_8_69_26]|nr:MAG: type IV pilin [Halobacteriales archaeon QS_8_69_26]